MDHTSNVCHGRLFIRGLLTLLCVFAIPKLASSEVDRPAGRQNTPIEQKKAFPLFVRRPTGMSSRISPDSKDCASAKLDIWLQSGTMTYTTFMPESDLRFKALVGGTAGTTMLIGDNECLIRVRIEPVPAGTTVYD
jgi:hypothetical protein